MKGSLLLLFCLSVLLPANASSLIRECSTIRDVLPEIQPGTLIVFDLDNTLMHPCQMLGSDEWFQYYLMKTKLELHNDSEAFARAVELLHSVYYVTKVQAMEECTASVLHELQAKGVSLIGLTSRSPEVSLVTIRQLASLGIDMSLTAPSLAYFPVIDVSETLFQQGVLFAHGKSKKNVLSGFFRQLSWRPKRIVFIDDRKKYLEEASSYEEEGIEFVGLRYTGGDAYVQALDPKICDEELLVFQNVMSDSIAMERIMKQEKTG